MRRGDRALGGPPSSFLDRPPEDNGRTGASPDLGLPYTRPFPREGSAGPANGAPPGYASSRVASSSS
ncbi:hypothetical protein [Sphaerisporangium sp. NPDC051011]|uniref:hypothetical protein n=1 Tax=Sphaerisporangium sp. NPDC051011 TaxID=3155792 RepID=UPI0033F769D1